jgi:hypothetical protein
MYFLKNRFDRFISGSSSGWTLDRFRYWFRFLKHWSYHMTPHKEWFYEYEKYDGGDVFLGDDSTAKILGRGNVKSLLKDGRIRTLPGVLHIP